MLIFYSPNHFISSPYLLLPVSQMNVSEIKRILKHCEVSTVIFLRPSLGNLFFLLVCSVVGIGKGRKNKTKHYSMLFLSFFSLPRSLGPACALPSLFFLTCPESPAIYLGFHQCNDSRFASDPRKWGNLCTRTRGLTRFRNIIYVSPRSSDVEPISVSCTEGTPVVLGGKKFIHTPLLSFIDWLFVWRMVWRRF